MKVRHILGLDIGSNSVGSAWVDTESETVRAAVSVFPAGTEEREDKRGDPVGVARRGKRLSRRIIRRRSERKRLLRKRFVQLGWLPGDPVEYEALVQKTDPWLLRANALIRPLEPFELGRVLLHLVQRRGAVGLKLPEDSEAAERAKPAPGKKRRQKEEKHEEEKIETETEQRERRASRAAWSHTLEQMKHYQAETFGDLVAKLREDRVRSVDVSGQQQPYQQAIRNRRDLLLKKPEQALFATRDLIRKEFQTIWDRQRSFSGTLGSQLNKVLLAEFDDPELPKRNDKWRHGGLIFGQRATKWDLGILGRCDLEPADRRCPVADRHAQHFRVIQTVNDMRIERNGRSEPLSRDQRNAVIQLLSGPLFKEKKDGSREAKKSANLGDVKVALLFARNDPGIKINLGSDEDRPPTDWFQREIVLGAIGEEIWNGPLKAMQEEINRTLLRLDPETTGHEARLRSIATQQWNLPDNCVQRLAATWNERPKLDNRLKLSRRAILNLLRYMEEKYQLDGGIWPSVTNARESFARDPNAIDQLSGKPASKEQRARYALGVRSLTKAGRRYIRKHEAEGSATLPPAPFLPNPVVRRAIHEVRRHVLAWMRKFGKRPDRVSIELSREARLPGNKADEIRALNTRRNRIRTFIQEEVIRPVFKEQFTSLTSRQLRAAENRVLLCLQQRYTCAYSGLLPERPEGVCCYTGKTITPRQAALGDGLQMDHIIPVSKTGPTRSLNSLVLCYSGANAGKGNDTPRQWLGAQFEGLSQRFKWWDGYEPPKLKDKADRGDFFTKKDYTRKWKLLNLAEPPKEPWRASQLTDTSYAARQVRAYLAQALFTKDTPEQLGRRFLHPKGAYTAILRRDWQLFQRVLPRDSRGKLLEAEETRAIARKDRFDHRHHAIDAVTIALMNHERLENLAAYAKCVEEAKAEAEAKGLEKPEKWPEREPLDPPWGTVKQFRREVLSRIFAEFDDADTSGRSEPVLVCHRVVKRKLVGHLHKDTHFGPVANDEKGVLTTDGRLATPYVTLRVSARDIKPDHLRLPRIEAEKEAVNRVYQQLRSERLDTKTARATAKDIVADPSFERLRVQPIPGKSGVISKVSLRIALREKLGEFRPYWEAQEKDDKAHWPEQAKKDFGKRIKELVRTGVLVGPNGFPIHRVKIVRTLEDPILIRRRQRDLESGRLIPDRYPQSIRIYEGQNNHHVEIRESAKGEWVGTVVDMFTAARRVRPVKNADGTRPPVSPVADRSDNGDGRFVMSLAEGETVLLRDPRLARDDFFVVAKIDRDPIRVHLFHHVDARSATGRKDEKGKVIPDSKREVLGSKKSPGLPLGALRKLAPSGYPHPVKVEVGPLGDWHAVDERDDRDRLPVPIDPRVVDVAKKGLQLRVTRPACAAMRHRKKLLGSWSWMVQELDRQGLTKPNKQLSAAIRSIRADKSP